MTSDVKTDRRFCASWTDVPLRRACVYAGAFDNGVVKLGCTDNPRMRAVRLNWQTQQEMRARLVGFYAGPEVAHPLHIERALLKHASAIAAPLASRREFFTGLPFDVACGLVDLFSADNTTAA